MCEGLELAAWSELLSINAQFFEAILVKYANCRPVLNRNSPHLSVGHDHNDDNDVSLRHLGRDDVVSREMTSSSSMNL